MRELAGPVVTRGVAALLVAWVGVVPAATAQVSSIGQRVEARNYPPVLPSRKGPSPRAMKFELSAAVPIPGRLSGAAPIPADGVARVPLVGAIATSALRPDAVPQVEPAPAPLAASDWVQSESGKRRYRTVASGEVVAEKRCRHCASGWRSRWTLRIPGATPAPPVLLGRRLFFGALDGRVYCLRSDNGHRVWAVDVGDRVSRPIALWHPPATAGGASPFTFLLVANDGGGTLLALDSYDGARIATFEVPPAEGRLATAAAAAADGTVLIGREKYAASEAELLVLNLVEAPAPARAPKSGSPHGKLDGRSGEEDRRGEDRPRESRGTRPHDAARALSGDAAVAQDRRPRDPAQAAEQDSLPDQRRRARGDRGGGRSSLPPPE